MVWWSHECASGTTQLPAAADRVLRARTGTSDADVHLVLWFGAALRAGWALRRAPLRTVVVAGAGLWAYTVCRVLPAVGVQGARRRGSTSRETRWGSRSAWSVGLAVFRLLVRHRRTRTASDNVAVRSNKWRWSARRMGVEYGTGTDLGPTDTPLRHDGGMYQERTEEEMIAAEERLACLREHLRATVDDERDLEAWLNPGDDSAPRRGARIADRRGGQTGGHRRAGADHRLRGTVGPCRPGAVVARRREGPPMRRISRGRRGRCGRRPEPLPDRRVPQRQELDPSPSQALPGRGIPSRPDHTDASTPAVVVTGQRDGRGRRRPIAADGPDRRQPPHHATKHSWQSPTTCSTTPSGSPTPSSRHSPGVGRAWPTRSDKRRSPSGYTPPEGRTSSASPAAAGH